MQYSLQSSSRILNLFLNGANYINKSQNTESLFFKERIFYFLPLDIFMFEWRLYLIHK